MRNVTIVLAVAAVLALSGSAWSASTYTWDNDGGAGDGKWVTPDNWNLTAGLGNPDGLPHYKYPVPSGTFVNDPAIIASGYTVTFGGTDWGDCGGLSLSGTINQTGGTGKSMNGSVNVGGIYNQSGGTYIGAGTFYIRGTYNLSDTGYINTGGSKQGVYGTLNQTGGTSEAGYTFLWTGSPTYKISGGKHIVKSPISTWAMYMKDTSTYHVVGGGPEEITLKGGLTMYAGSAVKAEIDAVGFETINIVKSAAWKDSAPTVGDGSVTFESAGDPLKHATIEVIDSGAADSTYTIMTWTGSVTGTPVVTLPDASWSWNDSSFASDGAIIVTVPEPVTMVLLGIGGLGVLLRRKNRS
ncbi:MAG: PEP-CTERM sorting domain-containing protein [Phycisphaerae bacterium]|nr:PEP-CTERM sorting domain-containing protein [Phycisphaerae bacterium]